METLVVVAQQRSQYCSRGKPRVSDGFPFEHRHSATPSPSRAFKGINCRTFHSSTGILPPPPPPFPEPKSPCFYSEPPKQRRSKPIAINPALPLKGATFNDDLSSAELWAGPAYSNSPPPSSLPIPKFSLRQKRSISLELPITKPEFEMRPLPKSAPSSPTKRSANGFCLDTAVATENLRRILHLDIDSD